MTVFLDFCIKFLNLEKNVAKIVGTYKTKNEFKEKKIYSLNQYKKFISCVNDEMYKQFFNLMFFTGTRPGEAMALKFCDLNKYFISINKTIDEHGTRDISTPKTASSIRKVAIDKKMYYDLIKLKNNYVKKYNDCSYDYYIFGGLKPLSPTTVNRRKIEACNKANLYPIRLHDFRHSHATMLYQKHINVYAIKERLGHSDINITMGTYIHPNNSQKKELLKLFHF